MAFEDTMRSLREFDLSRPRLRECWVLAAPIKVLIWVALLVAVLVAGYYYHIKDLQMELAKVEATGSHTQEGV